MTNWILSPTKKTVIIVFVIWLAATGMIFLASDYFRELNFMSAVLIIGSLFSVIKIFTNYKKVNVSTHN